jgi:serine/threonine-protein phosphatase PGAM5
MATFLYQYQFTACEAPKPAVNVTAPDPTRPSPEKLAGMRPEEQGDYHGLFPKRQLWQPRVEYPLWDNNWDFKEPLSTGDKEADRMRSRKIRKTGVTRHIILVRHAQYDETHKEDEKRLLTELGRKQAEVTGKRLAEMVKGVDDKFGPCNVKVIRVSDLARAKETAAIIARYLPDVELAEPDKMLNEARPAHTIPGGKANESTIEKTDHSHPTVEAAFRKYFYRADTEDKDWVLVDNEYVRKGQPQEAPQDNDSKHEFEIIVW